MASALILPLDSADATLANAGGKGLNLVRLTRSGFPVPPGFILTTAAYSDFVTANQIDAVIDSTVKGVALGDTPRTASPRGDTAALESASATIRAAFTAGTLPESVGRAIEAAASGLADVPVAVRSSATAEDLPELSFAGQQDTFLNVRGAGMLRRAVIDCWSSLWTARAIGYRHANDIPQRGVALAVVVQRLVPAAVSGVMFTANPITGKRSELVIDATPGLGDALVSGQVEPDHFLIDNRTGEVIERSRGSKAVVTLPLPGGGVETRVADSTQSGLGVADHCLTDAQLADLARVGTRVASEFGSPQDIEWAIADDTLHVLQARPITSLFPVPETGGEFAMWFSFAAVQGLLEPITPLGQDAIKSVFSGLLALVGERADERHITLIRSAGERLWIRFDGVFRSRFGHRLTPRILSMLEPSVGAAVQRLLDEPALRPVARFPSRRSCGRMLRLLALVVPRLPRALMDPVGQRHRFEGVVAALVRRAVEREAAVAGISDPRERLAARAAAVRAGLAGAFPVLIPAFAPIMGPSLIMVHRLNTLAASLGPSGAGLALEALRGLDGNVTTAMDLSLWRVAQVVRSDPASRQVLLGDDVDTLVALYRSGALPPPAQRALTAFLEDYGMRGVGEIDLGQPRWRERPDHVLRTLASYVRIDQPDQAPDVVYRSGQERAARAAADLVDGLRHAPGVGPVARRIRARQAAFLISRVRGMMGARETPKFGMVQVFGIMRRGLLESAEHLVATGLLDRPEDIAFLRIAELERLSAHTDAHWRRAIAERRAALARERRRGQVPRLLVSDGRAFFEGVGDVDDDAITGSPVSPGVAEGVVRVVLDPRIATLAPGEILVCAGTDPAWTPLFLAAGGLVTEVGGMMTHGSVVAREYGIPAVVGVHDATRRLTNGMRIRLDGTNGTIRILDGQG